MIAQMLNESRGQPDALGLVAMNAAEDQHVNRTIAEVLDLDRRTVH